MKRAFQALPTVNSERPKKDLGTFLLLFNRLLVKDAPKLVQRVRCVAAQGRDAVSWGEGSRAAFAFDGRGSCREIVSGSAGNVFRVAVQRDAVSGSNRGIRLKAYGRSSDRDIRHRASSCRRS